MLVAARIVADLIEEGYVAREKVGRRNRYIINREALMRHSQQMGRDVGPLLDVLRLDAADELLTG